MPPTPDSEGNKNRTLQSNSKLNRLINEYELDALGKRIEDRWLTNSDDRYSLRELATYVNQQLLRTVMYDAGMDPLDGEVENMYRLLTSEDISTGTRTQARRRLQRAGVDVDQLNADFISRQAVHTYLTNDRGVSYTTDKSDPVAKEAVNIRRLKRRMTTMTDGKLEQLRDTDHITLGEFNVLLDLRVLCEDCNTQYQMSELLEARACDCSERSD